jgi:hypothetical protein
MNVVSVGLQINAISMAGSLIYKKYLAMHAIPLPKSFRHSECKALRKLAI